MAAKHRVAFGLALLMVVALPVSGSGAGEAHSPDRTVGLGDSASTPEASPSKPWPAPVGHRQPRAAELPAHLPKTASDLAQERRDRELDRRLQICHRC